MDRKESNNDELYSRIIVRQGEGLMENDRKIKELQEQLLKERMDRIEDLKSIESWATSNCYNNPTLLLRKVAEIASDKRKELMGVNANKKEISSHTDQDI